MQVCICLLKSITVEFAWRIFFPPWCPRPVQKHPGPLRMAVFGRGEGPQETSIQRGPAKLPASSGQKKLKDDSGAALLDSWMFVGKKLRKDERLGVFFHVFSYPFPIFLPFKKSEFSFYHGTLLIYFLWRW